MNFQGSNSNLNVYTDTLPDNVTLQTVVAREQELARRTEDLERRESAVSQALLRTLPNFPHFKLLCIRPIIYHSISSEVPSENVIFTKICYVNFYLSCILLLFNFVTSLVGAIAAQDAMDIWQSHAIVSGICLIGIAGAFIVWYFPLYKSASTGREFGCSFMGSWIGLLYSLFMMTGIMPYGGCGIMFTVDAFKAKQPVTGIMGSVCSVLWGFQVIFFFIVLRKVSQWNDKGPMREQVSFPVTVTKS